MQVPLLATRASGQEVGEAVSLGLAWCHCPLPICRPQIRAIRRTVKGKGPRGKDARDIPARLVEEDFGAERRTLEVHGRYVPALGDEREVPVRANGSRGESAGSLERCLNGETGN